MHTTDLARPILRTVQTVALARVPRDVASKPYLPLDTAAAISFLLTLLKLPLALALALAATFYHVTSVSVIILLAIILDIADGVVFEGSLYRHIRDLRRCRRILDTLADRALIGTALLALGLTLRIPFLVLSAILMREAFLAIVAGYPFIASGSVLKPRLFSRTATALSGFLLIAALQMQTAVNELLFLYLLTAAVGLLQYLQRPEYE